TRKVAAVVLSPDARTLAVSWTGKEGNEVRLYDTDLGLERVLHTGHTGPVTCLAFSPKGTKLATTSPDRTVRLWEADDLGADRTLPKLLNEPRCLTFSADERIV